MTNEPEKLLLALDCYDQSIALTTYISEIVPPDRYHVVLFHIAHQVPEAFLDIEKAPAVDSEAFPVNDWAKQEKAAAEAFLDRAKRILLDAGFPGDSISIKFQPTRRGIARDILDESQKGYKALVLGRAETNARNEINMGTVTAKLVGKAHHIPIAVVGGKPDSGKVLVGFDKSAGAMEAVDFVNAVFRGADCGVTLCHVIRSLKIGKNRHGQDEDDLSVFLPEHELRWQKMARSRISPFMDGAVQKFVDSGWPWDKVSGKVIVDTDTRSRCLVNEALDHNFGTIVVGRRGTSMVREFFLGRVGQKVLNMAVRHAVWIIG